MGLEPAYASFPSCKRYVGDLLGLGSNKTGLPYYPAEKTLLNTASNRIVGPPTSRINPI